MNTIEAEKLSRLFLNIEADLNQSIAYVRDFDNEEEYLRYRKMVGQVLGTLYLDAMEPLWKRFPELRPDDQGGQYKVTNEIYEPLFYTPAEKLS